MDKLNWTKDIYAGKTLNYWFCYYKLNGLSYKQIATIFEVLTGKDKKFLMRTCKRKNDNHMYLETKSPESGSNFGTSYFNEFVHQGGTLAYGWDHEYLHSA